ncbi:hypothetical protein QEN19_004362 [Hanseniaspora menglaensis]
MSNSLEHQINLFKANYLQKNMQSRNESEEHFDLMIRDITSNVALLIDSKNITLLSLVMALKNDITSVDDENRQCSLDLLANVLSKIQQDTLLNNECNVIFDFFLSKILNGGIDIHCFRQILDGIYHILGFKNLAKSFPGISHLLKFFADDYNPNEFVATIRYKIFTILKLMLSGNFVSDQDLYVSAFMNVANGEKDPRNLMESFKINKQITSTFNSEIVYSNSQKLFDLLFCYFPITFKPPKNDPYKISSEELKTSLREALSNCDSFSIDCFPNLIDKLSATSLIVKHETLNTLKACIAKYSCKSIASYWQPIWDALKNEVLRNSADEVDEEYGVNNYKFSLEVIMELFAKLENFVSKDFTFDKIVLQFIFEDLKHNFESNKNLKQTSEILAAASSINLNMNSKIMNLVLPVLFEPISLKKEMDMESHKLLLMNMAFFLKVVSEFDEELSKENALYVFKDDILILLTQNLTTTSDNEVHIKTLSIFQLTNLVKIKNFLSEDEIEMIAHVVKDTLNSNASRNKNIFLACLDNVKIFASSGYTDIVKQVTLCAIFDNLKTAESQEIFDKNLKTAVDIVLASSNLTAFVISELVNYIQPSTIGDLESCFLVVSAVYTLLDSKLNKIGAEKNSNETNFNSLFTNQNAVNLESLGDELIYTETIDQLYQLMFVYDQIFDHDGIMEVIGLIFYDYVITLSVHDQNTFALRYIVPIVDQVFISANRLIIFFSKVVAAISIDQEVLALNELFEKCLKLVYVKTDAEPIIKTNYFVLISLLVNKDRSLIDSIDIFEQIYENSSHNIVLIFWISKGLSLSNHKLSTRVLQFLITLIDDLQVGDIAAQCFSISMMNLTTFRKLKTKSPKNLNINSLYQQKMFHTIVPTLIKNYKLIDDETIKSRYLISLSHVLRNSPVAIKTSFTQELFPLLINALDAQSQDVKSSSIQTINDTFVSQPEMLLSHVDTLIKKSLISASDLKNSEKVRILSLRTLILFVEVVPINLLQPYKDVIIDGIIPILDDPKRSVRKWAVDTRQAYFDLGQAII